MRRAGLEPATNGLPAVTSGPNQISSVFSCGATAFAHVQLRREPAYFHRFPFIGGEYSVSHVPRDDDDHPELRQAFQAVRKPAGAAES
jgi:hypothetical protein